MYRILCCGDSNTWGYNPANGLRFSERDRWPGVMGQKLGAGFEVVEDGRNGRRLLEAVGEIEDILSHNNPLDLIIIYLGINDICFENELRVDDLLAGAKEIIKKIKDNYREIEAASPQILFLGIVPINEQQVRDCLYASEAEKVLRFTAELRGLCGEAGCGFFEPGTVIETSAIDGIHLEASKHRILGEYITDYVRSFIQSYPHHPDKKAGL